MNTGGGWGGFRGFDGAIDAVVSGRWLVVVAVAAGNEEDAREVVGLAGLM